MSETGELLKGVVNDTHRLLELQARRLKLETAACGRRAGRAVFFTLLAVIVAIPSVCTLWLGLTLLLHRSMQLDLWLCALSVSAGGFLFVFGVGHIAFQAYRNILPMEVLHGVPSNTGQRNPIYPSLPTREADAVGSPTAP